MRICYNCQFFDFDPGSPGYSEDTPGSAMTMECLKEHWSLGWSASANQLREHLESANTCPDYQHSDKAKELRIPDEDSVALTKHVRYHHDEPVLCKSCGTQLVEYNSSSAWGDKWGARCPQCHPVSTAIGPDGPLPQRLVFGTREEIYYA